MPIPDAELDRMLKNLQRAFNTASAHYEAASDIYGASNPETRKRAKELAAISQAYLEAQREQDQRLAEKDRPKLPKPPKSP